MSSQKQIIDTSILKDAVIQLSQKYNFDYIEALNIINFNDIVDDIIDTSKPKPIDKKINKPKKIPIPFAHQFDNSVCHGLKFDGGLYTQCAGKKVKHSIFCNKCFISVNTNGGKATYGSIQDRLTTPLYEFTDPSGKKPVAYTSIMKKHNLTKEEVINEGKKQGINNIPEEHFTYIHIIEKKQKKQKK